MKGECPSTRDSTASALPGLFNKCHSETLPAMTDTHQGSTSGQASVPVCPRGMGEARGSTGKSSWVWVQL